MQVEVDMKRLVSHDGSQQVRHHGWQPGRWSADGEAPEWRAEIRDHSTTGGMANRGDGLRSTASPSTPRRVGVVRPRHSIGVGVWAAVRPWRGSDARLGLYAPGGDRVGQCGVVAFVLVGVGLGEVGHGLVEGV